jgi:hypothetical protein
VEGYDLSRAWRGRTAPGAALTRGGTSGAFEQDALLTMNFTAAYDHLVNGDEWRGVRTKTHGYSRWLDGTVELHDLVRDPLQLHNLVEAPGAAALRAHLERRLAELMARRFDQLVPSASYGAWFDQYRRVIRNAYGPLGDPEGSPDWSLLA